MMRNVQPIALLLCLILCAGCVIIPIPTPGIITDESQRAPINAELLKFIKAGSASKEDILLKFGEPESYHDEEKLFVYSWTEAPTHLLWLVSGGYSGVGGVVRFSNTAALRIEFDEKGIVKKYGIKTEDTRTSISISR